MKRYPVYKDSGVEGLGEIPEHWELKRLASFGTFSKGSTISKSDLVGNGLPVILYGDIYTKYNVRAETIFHFISQDLAANSKQIYKGDLLFTGSGETKEDIGKCIVYNGNSKVYAGGDIIIFTQKTNDSLFLAYFFSSNYAITKKAMNSRGDIVVHIYASSLRNIYIPIPPFSEQKAIAHFLDHKLEQVEQYICNKQRLIELLNEQKTAIINRAVTKGISPNAPMKHSGIEWLGEIPAHWKLQKISHLCRIVRGGSPRPAGHPNFFGGNYCPWITVGEVTKDEQKTLEFVSEYLTYEGCKYSRYLAQGTLVLTNSGATLGVPKILNISGCINDGLVAFLNLKEHLISIDYLYYYFVSLTHNYRERIKQGAGQPNLNTDIIKTTPIPLGKIDEQLAIIKYIDNNIRKIHLAIAQIEKEIELIQEYRTTLISDAVTGKIDVRPNSLIKTTLTA